MRYSFKINLIYFIYTLSIISIICGIAIILNKTVNCIVADAFFFGSFIILASLPNKILNWPIRKLIKGKRIHGKLYSKLEILRDNLNNEIKISNFLKCMKIYSIENNIELKLWWDIRGKVWREIYWKMKGK